MLHSGVGKLAINFIKKMKKLYVSQKKNIFFFCHCILFFLYSTKFYSLYYHEKKGILLFNHGVGNDFLNCYSFIIHHYYYSFNGTKQSYTYFFYNESKIVMNSNYGANSRLKNSPISF